MTPKMKPINADKTELDDIKKAFENLLEKMSGFNQKLKFEDNCKAKMAFDSLVGSITVNYSYFNRLARPSLDGIDLFSD